MVDPIGLAVAIQLANRDLERMNMPTKVQTQWEVWFLLPGKRAEAKIFTDERDALVFGDRKIAQGAKVVIREPAVRKGR